MLGQLNEKQYAAATYSGDAHVLLLAGAGSGKTSVIVSRVLHLVETGTPPPRILLLTFTRRAAKEMQERLHTKLGSRCNGIVAGTFHWFALSVMKRMPTAFGIGNATIIDKDDQDALMKLARAPEAGKDKEFPKAGVLVNYYSFARNTDQPPADYLIQHTEMGDEYREKTLKIFADYENRKRKNGYLDYDDLLLIFVRKLEENPRIAEQVKGLFDYVLVDETQDTNPVQFRILDNLREPARLFCVGDDAQSIYAFRGADFQNVHSFTERVPNSVVMRLETNYRSTQEILDISNWLLDQSRLAYDKKLVAARGTGFTPRLIDFPSEFAEGRWVAQNIQERQAAGWNYADHMILIRSAFAGRAMETVLVEEKIPYKFVGGNSIFAAAHVKDLLSLLRVADSHYDELAMMRFLCMWPGIGSTKAAKAIAKVTAVSTVEEADRVLLDAFPDLPQTVDAIRRVRNYRDNPKEAILVAQRCLDPLLSTKYDHWPARLKDFALLAKLASEQNSIHSFIETYTLDPVTTSTVSNEDAQDVVTLITVHSAKGTEAKVTYLIQAQEGMYPHSRSLGDFDAEEEERRILYVAATRAKDFLFISRVSAGGGGYRTTQMATCPENGYFLEDLPEHLVEYEMQGFGQPKQSSAFSTLQDF